MTLAEVSLLITIITGILGIVGTISGFYLRGSKRVKDKKEKARKEKDQQKELYETVARLEEKLDRNTQSIEVLQKDSDTFHKKFDNFETQQVRYIINASFLGYECMNQVPDEILLNAAECCDIYLAKGLNHGTGAKCKIIAEEIEKRARLRAEQEGGKHE